MGELMLAFLIIGVGLSVAGMATHLYQGLARQPAVLRWDGATVLGGIGHLAVSFLCGPYLMLRMSLERNSDGTISPVSVLLASIIAFGWSFLTGLAIVGSYVALVVAM